MELSINILNLALLKGHQRFGAILTVFKIFESMTLQIISQNGESSSYNILCMVNLNREIKNQLGESSPSFIFRMVKQKIWHQFNCGSWEVCKFLKSMNIQIISLYGESLSYDILCRVNLNLEIKNQLGESSPNFIFRIVNCYLIVLEIDELMVNHDQMILLKKSMEVKTWGGWVDNTDW